VTLPAPKGATKVFTICITGMGEKKYVAMPATGQTFSEMGLFPKNRANDKIIAKDNPADLSITVPVRNELKMTLYLYYKKAKCSLISLMYPGIPS